MKMWQKEEQGVSNFFGRIRAVVNLSCSCLFCFSVSGDVNDFRHPLRKLKAKLNNKLLKFRQQGYYEAHDELVKDELDVQSLLSHCAASFCTFLFGTIRSENAHARTR